MTEDLVERMRAALRGGPARRQPEASDIDEVVLVGGATRMPMVQELVRKLIEQRAATRASTRTRSWRSARPSRPACWAAR